VVEQPAVNRLVAGSNPARGANLFKGLDDPKKRRKTADLQHIYKIWFRYGPVLMIAAISVTEGFGRTSPSPNALSRR